MKEFWMDTDGGSAQCLPGGVGQVCNKIKKQVQCLGPTQATHRQMPRRLPEQRLQRLTLRRGIPRPPAKPLPSQTSAAASAINTRKTMARCPMSLRTAGRQQSSRCSQCHLRNGRGRMEEWSR